jgi:hypothetical protein
LNSHFYSASIDECVATLANFNGAWRLEASEVFAMDLPDPMSGALPCRTSVPVYRTWNGRLDSNHRYTTSIAIRNQMIAKGHVAEGYGPKRRCALRIVLTLRAYPGFREIQKSPTSSSTPPVRAQQACPEVPGR